MNESEQYVTDSIKIWVWSGFYSAQEMDEMIEDIIDDDCDVAVLKAFIAQELKQKLEAERLWPKIPIVIDWTLFFTICMKRGSVRCPTRVTRCRMDTRRLPRLIMTRQTVIIMATVSITGKMSSVWLKAAS
ncbi:hypothetical protein ALP63_03023 [Pseudomonas syringae pv. aceris]|nr:hypothetical protein [Pseudomonas syringae]RMS56587.1 hypothetical protein ALP63_03023 [Pseudomonas syringae pv. aceris]